MKQDGGESPPASPVPATRTPTGSDATAKPAAVTPPPAAPTAEEQMAMFEESLKDTDWGHQPC